MARSLSAKPALLPVSAAIARLLADVTPTATETVPLARAAGRTLAGPLAARRTQPSVALSSMDGYAVRAADAEAGAVLRVVGVAPAGRPFAGTVATGEAVRIFTGAVLPAGADSVLLQEDATQTGDARIAVGETVHSGQFVRQPGLDFAEGDVLLAAGRRLGPREIALAAAMNHAAVPVRHRPRVAILANGDELVASGRPVAPHRTVDATSEALAALVAADGGEPIRLGIVGDDATALRNAFERAVAASADVILTLGGASVGDHDLIRPTLVNLGFDLDFWRIALRPGRPTLSGRMGPARVLGLPGNPVSSLVCGLVLLRPLLLALQGDPDPARDMTRPAQLGVDLPANDARQDYLRARLVASADGLPLATPLPRQDSSMLATLAAADCLLIRPPFAPAAAAGESCRVLPLP